MPSLVGSDFRETGHGCELEQRTLATFSGTHGINPAVLAASWVQLYRAINQSINRTIPPNYFPGNKEHEVHLHLALSSKSDYLAERVTLTRTVVILQPSPCQSAPYSIYSSWNVSGLDMNELPVSPCRNRFDCYRVGILNSQNPLST
jgi:hypothetical protein